MNEFKVLNNSRYDLHWLLRCQRNSLSPSTQLDDTRRATQGSLSSVNPAINLMSQKRFSVTSNFWMKREKEAIVVVVSMDRIIIISTACRVAMWDYDYVFTSWVGSQQASSARCVPAPRFFTQSTRVNDSKLIHTHFHPPSLSDGTSPDHVGAVNNDNVMMILIELHFIKILSAWWLSCQERGGGDE